MLFIELYAEKPKPFLIQNPHRQPKLSSHIEIGAHFKCSQKTHIQASKSSITIYPNTVGVRFGEADFFISKGTIQIHEVHRNQAFEEKFPELVLRFARGELSPQTSSTLSIHNNGQIRWLKPKDSGLTSIQVDNMNFRISGAQLFIAETSHYYITEKNEGLYQYDELTSLPLNDLMLISRLVKDSHPSKSLRLNKLQPFVSLDIVEEQRKHHQVQSRRYSRFYQP